MASIAMSMIIGPLPGVADAQTNSETMMNTEHSKKLNATQKAIAPIGAFAAIGDMIKLNVALNRGLDAGLSVAQCKEILVQIYAYAGFPRSLNALGEMMKVLDERTKRGIQDAVGNAPSPLPPAADMLEVGERNQTQLVGAPVKGALFDFAPTINQYLKAHLFGDIFARDNLDWQSRELATVGALSSLIGVTAQLQSHLKVSLNIGLSPEQLKQLPQVLEQYDGKEAAKRLQSALDAVLP